jgi:hypothetical protein
MMNLQSYAFIIFLPVLLLLLFLQFRLLRIKGLFLFSPILHLFVFDIIFYYRVASLDISLIIYSFSFLLSVSFISGFIFFENRSTLIPENLTNSKIILINTEDNSERLRFISIGALTFGLLSILLIVIINKDIIAYLFTEGSTAAFGQFYKQSRQGGSSLYFIALASCYCLIYNYYLSTTKFNIAINLAMLFAYSLLGGRGALVCCVFALVLINLLKNQLRLKAMLLFGLSVLLIIFIGTFLRSDNISNYHSSEVATLDYSLDFVLEDVLDHVSRYGASFGLFMEDLKLYVPRVLWDSKPTTTAETILIYPERIYQGGNLTLGLLGNALLNFNLLSIPLLMIFYFALGLVFYSLDRKRLSSIVTFFVIFLLCNQVFWLRGGIFQLRIFNIFISLLLGFLLHHLLSWLHLLIYRRPRAILNS